MRPFRFGAQYTGTTLEDWQDFARKAEDLGYSTLFLPDHFGDQLAPMPAMMAAANATTSWNCCKVRMRDFSVQGIRISLITGNPLLQP